MIRPVVDASVLLAIVNKETLDARSYDLGAIAAMSTVNVAEVLTKSTGMLGEQQRYVRAVVDSVAEIVPFSLEHARTAAALTRRTLSAGLSLGDRACLALALELGADVYTTDRAWTRVDVGCRVNLLR